MGKIVFFFIDFPQEDQPGITGGNISNSILIDQLAERFSVKVIAPNIPFEQMKWLSKKGVEVKTKNFSKSLSQRIKRILWFISNVRAEDIKENTIVTTNGTNIYKVRKAKRKIICRAFEDFDVPQSVGGGRSQLKKLEDFIAKKAIERSYRNANGVITNSYFMKGYLSKRLLDVEIKVLYPPIDLDVMPYRNVNSGIKKIGIINPSAKKGEKIFLGLAEKYSDIDFIYFSKEKKDYRQRNVVYGGWKSNRREIYSQIELLVVPSEWDEPFGRVSPESIFCGTPVLTSKKGGLPETVASEFVVDGMELEAWLIKLEWLINNPGYVKSAWESSLSIAQKFSLELHQESALKIFS